MEARFTLLEAQVTIMVAWVKFITSRPRKAKDREDDQSYGLNVNQRFFCGAGFLGLVAPNETMPHMLKNH
jgi:hypothetical protein